MNGNTDLLGKVLPGIPEKYRHWISVAVMVSPVITRAYHAIASGGGIKGIFSAIWLGTNTPKVLQKELVATEKQTQIDKTTDETTVPKP